MCSKSGAGASGAGFAREMLERPVASVHLGRGAESLVIEEQGLSFDESQESSKLGGQVCRNISQI